jgi:hypothetical protein
MKKLGESHPLVKVLGLIILFIHLTVQAQDKRIKLTLEQVNQAVGEIQKLCANEIEQDAVPRMKT